MLESSNFRTGLVLVVTSIHNLVQAAMESRRTASETALSTEENSEDLHMPLLLFTTDWLTTCMLDSAKQILTGCLITSAKLSAVKLSVEPLWNVICR